MSVLNHEDIKKYLDAGLVVDASKEVYEQVNPNSIDLTLCCDEVLRPAPACVWYGDTVPPFAYRTEHNVANITLMPGEAVLVTTREKIAMPKNLYGQIFTKSTLGRCFINHMLSGVVDAGFVGRLTLELKNDGPWAVVIPEGARIVQMILHELTAPVEKGYRELRQSRYGGCNTPLPPMAERKA